MADIDLKDALNMFSTGVKELAFGNAIRGANEKVQQIKASGMKEEEQRGQLQTLSNNMVAHMASLGTPATTIEAVSKAFNPTQYKDANEMFQQGVLTNNPDLQEKAKTTQDFVNDPKFKMQEQKALIQAIASQTKADAAKLEKDDTLFGKFGKEINSRLASSRSPYGAWAKVENQGQRNEALLGDPSRWKNLSYPELSLVNDGLIQQVKGGVGTQEEKKDMVQWSLRLEAAKAKSIATGKPVSLDLTDYAKLATGMLKREGDTAHKNLQEIVMGIAANNKGLSRRDEKRYREVIASGMSQELGKQLTRDDIEIDDKKGTIRIRKNAINEAPKLGDAYGLTQGPSKQLSFEEFKALKAAKKL